MYQINLIFYMSLFQNHILGKSTLLKYTIIKFVVLHIPLAETVKELDNFILKGVDLYDYTKVFL